ncbi:MAG: putative secreted protein [Herminiimonas sp.]|nr:putative secreted protein [Herminiimonas sp.]
MSDKLQRNSRRALLRAAAAAAAGWAGAGLPGAALAADPAYPTKPIRLVVPFPPGSGAEVSARFFGQKLSEMTGQPVIIDPRGGGNGFIGVQAVLGAPHDGYTLLFGSSSTLATNAALFKKLPYDPLKDFSAISVVGGVPHALVVNPSLHVNSVPELVQYAKANPGALSYPYANSTTRITAATFGVMTQSKLLEVPYKAYPQAVSDLLGGQTKMMFIDFTTGLTHIKAGKLKVLAITPERSNKLPGVPAMSEVLPGFSIANWNGIFAPKGTPDDIVKMLNHEITAVLALPEVQKQVDTIGYELIKPMTPAEFTKYVVSEHRYFGELVRNAGIQPE